MVLKSVEPEHLEYYGDGVDVTDVEPHDEFLGYR